MSEPVRVCRHCDEVITDPADAVAVHHELSNSGPGWTVWAHRDHAELVDVIDSDLLRIMLRIWSARAERP
ncbi:hypothetical protein OG562_20205 [Streptomyces sp. NBC_01275]|uniref:hypothetical protein n=1 Tax=Streptomyces sp. NBC_01275 TaxID=2903807 RepID=UPI002258699D|nr:hypothetical protein [Streptomyces sp. NBC_01275]MCX4763249.1 hypothetical protein [Streptomyces sp. NBC_01275]